MSNLATYLQRGFDAERAAVANELHDVLDGLLVSAKFDVGLLERTLENGPDAVRTRLTKLKESLDNALAVNRRLVEQLYPSLLVHVGLNAALRWNVEEVCRRAGRPWAVNVPAEELPLSPDTAIALYRVAQEALLSVLAATADARVELAVSVRERAFTMRIASAGTVAQTAFDTITTDYAFLSMRQRAESIGGQLKREIHPRGEIAFTVELELIRQQ